MKMKEKFMTADEARARAEKQTLPYEMLMAIENEIKDACDLGKFSTSYWLNVEYRFIANKIISELCDRGFEVNQSDTDFRQIYIYWRNVEWD